MKNRCLNKNQARYNDYGGRGIAICHRWLKGDGALTGFQCFLLDMGPKPSADHTLERRDNDLGYDKDNCRWATRSEQARNTRATRYVLVCDTYMSLPDAVEYFRGPPLNTVRRRLKLGWSDDDAVLTAVGKRPDPHFEVCF